MTARAHLGSAVFTSLLLAVLSVGLVGCGDPSEAGQRKASAPQDASQDGALAEARDPETGNRVPHITDRPERWQSRLGNFLERGPTSGTWAVQGPSREWTWHFALNPIKHEEVLAAKVRTDGTIGDVSSVSRVSAPLFFFEAPSWMFFANYRIAGQPVSELLNGDVPSVRITWRPVAPTGGLTGRVVWFSRKTGSILQIEDRSRTGHATRRVRRVLDSPIKFDVESLALKAPPCCPNLKHVAAHDIGRALEAPFEVYVPDYLPQGYSLVRCDYREQTLGDESKGEERTVQHVSLLYSDGVGIISVGSAPTDHMDVISGHYNSMPVRDGNADVCPTLTGPPVKLLENRKRIRMRTDRCRTVLRHDGVAGEDGDLSVMLIGRNELPTETYVRMVKSLARYDHNPVNVRPEDESNQEDFVGVKDKKIKDKDD